MRLITIAVALSLGAITASAQPADSAEQLVERWKRAVAVKDATAYRSLFVSGSEQDITRHFENRAGMKMTSAKIVPFATYEKQYNASLERGAKPLTAPKAWLEVEYAAQSAGSATMKQTDVFLIGLKDGKYAFSH